MPSPQEIQEKFQEFQLVQQHLQQLTEHLEQMAQQMADLDISIRAIQEIEGTPRNNEFLAPVANGIFVAGELKETGKFIVNVGSDVTVERTSGEVISLLEKQKEEVMQKTLEAQAVVQQLQEYALKLYKEVEKKVNEK